MALSHPISTNNAPGEYWNVVAPFLKVAKINEIHQRTFVHDPLIYIQKWDTLQQLVFWRAVMQLPEDSAFLSIYQERKILDKIDTKSWEAKTEEEKKAHKDSLCSLHGRDTSTRILFTTGKSNFYNFQFCLNSIEMGIKIFEEQCVEPWYAQAILLIESPGHSYSSSAGALGSFQLMKSVGRKFGLTINKYQDDRQDFAKSAVAASRLIDEICLPETKKILDNMGIHYHESDLWFRLLVLHVYHAGAANVRGALHALNPPRGGKELITQLWQTEHGHFKNASQNYSQVALASLLELDRLIEQQGSEIYSLEQNH